MTHDAPDDPAPRFAPDDTPPAAVQRPRWWRLVLVVVLLALSAFLGWYGATQFNAPAEADPRAAFDAHLTSPAGQLLYSSSPTHTPGPLQTLLTQPGDADPLRFNAAHHPLDHEPADLPPFSTPHARTADNATTTNIGRYQLIDGAIVDEISYWRVPGSDAARQVEHHYQQAAAAAGFVKLEPFAPPSQDGGGDIAETSPDGHPSTSVFIDPDDVSRVLSVRVSPRDADLHVTVWLRCTAPPAPGSRPAH